MNETPIPVPGKPKWLRGHHYTTGKFSTRAELESAVWRIRGMTNLSTRKIAEAVGVTPYAVERILGDPNTRPVDLVGYIPTG